MRRKNNYLITVANNGKLRQRFMPSVPRTFDQDCWSISQFVQIRGEMLGEGVTFLSEILICSDYESFLYKPTYLNEPSFVNGKNEDK